MERSHTEAVKKLESKNNKSARCVLLVVRTHFIKVGVKPLPFICNGAATKGGRQ